jgi:hypothetical protein
MPERDGVLRKQQVDHTSPSAGQTCQWREQSETEYASQVWAEPVKSPSPVERSEMGEGLKFHRLRPLSEAKWEKVAEGRMRALPSSSHENHQSDNNKQSYNHSFHLEQYMNNVKPYFQSCANYFESL